jgi:hypothetical protein
MNYLNTFIQVAADSRATIGTAPKPRGGAKTVAKLKHELIAAIPYACTQEDLQSHVHAHLGLGKDLRHEFQAGQAVMRSFRQRRQSHTLASDSRQRR